MQDYANLEALEADFKPGPNVFSHIDLDNIASYFTDFNEPVTDVATLQDDNDDGASVQDNPLQVTTPISSSIQSSTSKRAFVKTHSKFLLQDVIFIFRKNTQLIPTHTYKAFAEAQVSKLLSR